MRLANEAINRWANYDNTYWRELFTTSLVNSTGGEVEIVTGTTQYAAPDDFQEAGGYIRIVDANGNIQERYPIIDPHERQFKADLATYGYFTGNPSTGYTLNLNRTPSDSLNGMSILYDYYATPTMFESDDDVSEMADPYFIVHRMLASQFRAARNPYYTSAKTDAENALRQMQLVNNSGTWANPWEMPDNSGSAWGL